MTGLDILIAVIAAIWVLKNSVVDVAFAVRGKTSPRLAARLAGRQGRYGPIKYFGDSLSDFWRGMRERREARLAGQTPPPRQRGWLGRTYGRLRGRITSWWDGATTRVDNRRQAELIQGQERLHTSRWQRFKDRMLGRDASAWPAVQRRPGEDFAGRPLRGSGDKRGPQPKPEQKPTNDAGQKPVEPKPDEGGEKPANGHQPVNLDGAPARTPIDNPRTQGAGEDRKENGEMAEAKGLNPTINWCTTSVQSAQTWKPRIEAVMANLRADEVSGPALDHLARATEAAGQLETNIAAAEAALIEHRRVAESYRGTNNQAGTKEHLLRGA